MFRSDVFDVSAEKVALNMGLGLLLTEVPRALTAASSSELLLAMHSCGQVARGWSLSTGALEALDCAQAASCAALSVELRCDARRTRVYSSRELAVLLLAHARVVRRGLKGMVFEGAADLCALVKPDQASREEFQRLTGSDGDTATDDTVAIALSATAMLLSHVSKRVAAQDSTDLFVLAVAALQCASSWTQLCPSHPALHKVVTSTAALGSSLIQSSRCMGVAVGGCDSGQLCLSEHHRLLPGFVGAVLELDGGVELFESWQIDSCLHALAVCEAFGLETPSHHEEMLVSEVCRRELRESSTMFWIGHLFQPALLRRSGLPGRLVQSVLRKGSHPAAETALQECLAKEMSAAKLREVSPS